MEMTDGGTLSRDLTIPNRLGIHARSAAQIARIAQAARSKIWIIRDGERADAKSVIDVLSLCCGQHTVITVEAADGADREIFQQIVELVESGFGEE
jgi:phosphocarrier protein HPr